MNDQRDKLRPAEWLKNYGDYLYSLAFLKVSSKETAEDLVQDTFISAYKAKDSFREDSSEKTWLAAILKNKIIDHYRKKDVLKDAVSYITNTESEFDSHFFNENNGHWLDSAAPASWNETADKKVNQLEFNKILQYCIQKMPPKLVPVFMAKFLDGEDSEVICKVFNISSSNYWVILHRAKVLMRTCLEKKWFLE